MPSSDDGDERAERTGATGLAGAVGVAAASGLGAAAEGSGWLFAPAAAGIEEAGTFLRAEGSAVRTLGSSIGVTTTDVRESWTDGTASPEAVLADVEPQTTLPLRDARTVVVSAGVAAADVDRVSLLDASELAADGRVTGGVVEGSFDTAAVVDGLRDVATVESLRSADSYDRYAVSHPDLSGDGVVAAGDGTLVVGHAAGVSDADGDVVDRLLDANAGEADRLGSRDAATRDVLDAVGDAPIVGGATWEYGSDATELVGVADGTRAADRYLPDGVTAAGLVDGLAAVAVGVEPSARRVELAAAYEDDAPTADVRKTLSRLESETELLDGVSWTVAAGDALTVTFEVTADRVASARERVRSETVSAGLRDRVVRGTLPTLEATYRVARGRLAGFVSRN